MSGGPWHRLYCCASRLADGAEQCRLWSLVGNRDFERRSDNRDALLHDDLQMVKRFAADIARESAEFQRLVDELAKEVQP